MEEPSAAQQVSASNPKSFETAPLPSFQLGSYKGCKQASTIPDDPLDPKTQCHRKKPEPAYANAFQFLSESYKKEIVETLGVPEGEEGAIVVNVQDESCYCFRQ